MTNVAVGSGTFGEGFRIGAAAGALGGLGGSLIFNSYRESIISFANNLVGPVLNFVNVKASAFPLSTVTALSASFLMAGFTYDQISKSCKEGDAYNWKTNRCEPSAIMIPLPTPNINE